MKRPHFFTAKAVDDRWGELDAHVRLWRAALDQLLQDLVYVGSGKEDKKAFITAWDWFENNHDDFRMVCDLADLDDVRTRKELKDLIARVNGNRHKRKFKNSRKAIERQETSRVRRQKDEP